MLNKILVTVAYLVLVSVIITIVLSANPPEQKIVGFVSVIYLAAGILVVYNWVWYFKKATKSDDDNL